MARMRNPAVVIQDAYKAAYSLDQAANSGGVPATTLNLVHLRVSQINGCGPCVDGGVKDLVKAGESTERIGAVSAWRHTKYFTDEERAALALAEYVTRMSDRPEPVPDAVWEEAAGLYDEQGLAALMIKIAATNVFNRFNGITHQTPGSAW
jgi:AhpD family alkylhydroperoxidase